MRERLPFFNGADRNDEPAHPLPPRQSAAPEPEAGPDDEPAGIHRLGGAFERIAEVVTEEIELLHETGSELDGRLSRRAETIKAETTAAIEGLRQSLLSRIDELRKEQHKALGEAGAETHRRIAELRQSFEQGHSRADARTDEVQAALEALVADREREIQAELGGLSGSLEQVRDELRQLTDASRNVTALLNGLAGVLSGHAALDEPHPLTLPRTGPEDPAPSGEVSSA